MGLRLGVRDKGRWQEAGIEDEGTYVSKKRIPLAELKLKNEANPGWVALHGECERTAAERVAKMRSEQAPLMKELASVGVHYETLGKMLNSAGPYKAAIPVLLAHLEKPYSIPTRETIARCLAVADARYTWPKLVELYRREPTLSEVGMKGAKDGLAVALAATATAATIDELIDIAKDKSHGSSGLLLLRALRRSKLPSAKQAIEELAADPDLAKEIASWRSHKVRLRTSNAVGEQ
jgi:hypothetical protein